MVRRDLAIILIFVSSLVLMVGENIVCFQTFLLHAFGFLRLLSQHLLVVGFLLGPALLVDKDVTTDLSVGLECVGCPTHLTNAVTEWLLLRRGNFDAIGVHYMLQFSCVVLLNLMIIRSLCCIFLLIHFDVMLKFTFDEVLQVTKIVVVHLRIGLYLIFEEFDSSLGSFLVQLLKDVVNQVVPTYLLSVLPIILALVESSDLPL